MNLPIGQTSQRFVAVQATIDVPAYAIVQVAESTALVDKSVPLKIVQPDGTGDTFYPLGAAKIDTENAKSGYSAACVAYPAWVLAEGTPEFNDVWGPVSGSWKLESSGTGFRVLYYDAENELALIVPDTAGAACDFVKFTIDTGGVTTDPDTGECLYVTVTITYRPCGCGSVPLETVDGKLLKVYDVDCKFAGIPSADLPGLKGDAKYMKNAGQADITGTVVTGPPQTATQFKTDLGAADDTYNEKLLVWTSGDLEGESQTVSDWVQSTAVITVESAFSAAPADGDTFVLKEQCKWVITYLCCPDDSCA